MVFLLIIGMLTLQLTLLNFRRLERINRLLRKMIIFFFVLAYLFGIVMYIKDFDADKFREDSIYALSAAFVVFMTLVAREWIGKRRKKKEDQKSK